MIFKDSQRHCEYDVIRKVLVTISGCYNCHFVVVPRIPLNIRNFFVEQNGLEDVVVGLKLNVKRI